MFRRRRRARTLDNDPMIARALAGALADDQRECEHRGSAKACTCRVYPVRGDQRTCGHRGTPTICACRIYV